ncbi:MAG TPA: DUF427 domain-containing protein [Bryobacteraceae bacterium]|jgi:uncharacterized protein (DUF427 family)
MQRTEPGPGQESVWDYPRPPRLEPTARRIRVIFAGETIAESTKAYRVLETSHPTVYYIPPDDVRTGALVRAPGGSFCEFKGEASYWSVQAGGRMAPDAAWSYDSPTGPFGAIRGYLAFYAGRVDACFVDEEKVEPQPGGFYGGWITPDVTGPFKGGPGSQGW